MHIGELFFIAIHFLLITAYASIIPIKSNRNGRLSLVEWINYNYKDPEGPGTYSFGYDVEDPDTNNIQFRNEERHPNGTVTGSYGYLEPSGEAFIVKYIADEDGYRATVENPARTKLKSAFKTKLFSPKLEINYMDLTNEI